MKIFDDTDESVDQWKLGFLLSMNRKTSQVRQSIPPGPFLWSDFVKFMWPERDVKLKLVIQACMKFMRGPRAAIAHHMHMLSATPCVGSPTIRSPVGTRHLLMSA